MRAATAGVVRSWRAVESAAVARAGRLLSLAMPVAVGLAGVLLVVAFPSPRKIVAALVGLLAATLITLRLELGLFALVFTCYAHLSQVLIDHHGAPSLLDPLVALLIALTAFSVTMRRLPLGPVLRAAAPIVAYGLAGLATLLVAVHPEATRKSLKGLVSDAVVALLIVALLRTRTALRGTIWTLLGAGLLLGSVSVHQELTKQYQDDYWGFGITAVQNIAGTVSDYRIGGPVGDPNFYALFLVPLLPLALDRVSDERRRSLRLLAFAALVVVCLAVVFTYSRGGFLSMAAVLALTFVRRPPRLRVVLLVLLVAVPLLSLIPSQYSKRLSTLPEVLSAGGGEGAQAVQDSGMRGRVSEMMVAALMFSEDPLLGVGLNNYPYLYQEYARRVGPDTRATREPHSRYLEVAAEMGLAGILTYGALLVSLFLAMNAGQRGLRAAGDPEAAGMVRAIEIGVVGFLIGSLFLHGGFARYFWVLAGIALATRNFASATVPRPEVPADAVAARAEAQAC